jgi:hypothetical protein
MMWKLEAHSSWKVIIDKKPGRRHQPLELLYTLVRMKGGRLAIPRATKWMRGGHVTAPLAEGVG